MREKFGIVISVIIALSLLYFIAPMDDLMTLFGGGRQDVGEINGNKISYEDFQREVTDLTTVNEIVTGSTVQSEQQQQQIRNTAWQSFIDKYLFLKNARAAGISVGNDEMVALTTGDMVSPLISQNYAFMDESGEYNPDALVEFVQNVSSDQSGRLATYWDYLQNTIYTQQMYSKYGALFTYSDVQNKLMKEMAVAETNETTDIDYVSMPFGYAPDSTVTVSGDEIRKYYSAHKDMYKQQASRDIEYVVYEVKPSQEDIAAVNTEFSDNYSEFSTTANVKNFLQKNSDRQYSEYWYKSGELKTVNADIDSYVFQKNATVSPVYSADNTFYAARVMAEANVPDSVYVKHILLQGNDAASKAEDLLSQVKADPKQFANLAALNSADKGSAADGETGNIGWMTQTYMIPGFESVITAKVGEPYIIKTAYGQHVVMVSKRTAPIAKKQVAIYEKEVIPSKETFNDYYAQANRFATLASGKYDNYRAAVDSIGAYSHPVNGVTESRSSYGTIDNAKEVTRWAFDNKAGKVSGIITVDNNYFFVVTVKAVHKEGYTPLSEVAQQIRSLLAMQKTGEKKGAEVADKIAGLTDINAVAEALDATVSSQSDIAFASMNSQGLDPKLVGAASVAKEGAVSSVVGSYAVYVFQVSGRETGAFYTEEDAEDMASRKTQYNTQMILPVMMSDADVKDNRARYY